MKNLRTRRACRFSISLLFVWIGPCFIHVPLVTAATSNWIGPGSDFNTTNNWDHGAPNDIAGFNAAKPTTIGFSDNTLLNGFTFNRGAAPYTFVFGNPNFLLSFNGPGIVNNSGQKQTIINNYGSVIFNNSSRAGNVTITRDYQGYIPNLIFNDASSADSATINNNYGTVSFNNMATAGQSSILNSYGQNTTFHNAASGGNASIANNGGCSFFETSTAGHATITNNVYGSTSFLDSSTAGNASITNSDYTGTLSFEGMSTAGSAQITNQSGIVQFSGGSTAGSAVIANNGTGLTLFHNTSSAGTAAITNNWNLWLMAKC